MRANPWGKTKVLVSSTLPTSSRAVSSSLCAGPPSGYRAVHRFSAAATGPRQVGGWSAVHPQRTPDDAMDFAIRPTAEEIHGSATQKSMGQTS